MMADNTATADETALAEPSQKQTEEPATMEAKEATMDIVSVSDPTEQSSEVDEMMKNLDMDPYEEDEAELRFLHSKPTCFIIIGKPGVGKSTMARRLASEWKCELINSTYLIQQNIELQTEMGVKCLEILTRGEAIPEDTIIKMIDDKVNSPEVAHHGYVLDDFPCLSEEHMSIRDQLELIKNWKLKPDFIINLKIPDTDIEKRRLGFKVDPSSGEIYTKEVYAPEKVIKMMDDREGEEEEEEEEEAEEEETGNEGEEALLELPPDMLERLVRRPEDLPEQVEENIKNYKINMLRILEDYMGDHDQQYLVEMDGNLSNGVIFKQLLQRLNCFVLRPAAVPTRLFDSEEDDISDEIQTDELMRQMGAKQMVAPRFRWRRSRWARSCPVALYEGNVINGKPEFSCSFLDKMYFLSSAVAMEKFLKNPRPYLLPPQPRPAAKFCVLGGPLSGKTTLCHLLAQKYGAKVINMEELIKPRMAQEKDKTLQQVREETTETAIVTVRNKIKEQMDAEAEAIAAAKEAAELAAQEAEELNDELEEEKEGGEEEESGRASAAKEGEKESETKPDEKTEGESKSETEAPKTPEGGTGEDKKEGEKDGEKDGENEGTDEGKADTEGSTKDSEPKSEAKEEKPAMPDIDATHPEVVLIVDAAIADAEKKAVQLSADAYVEVMEAAIKECEREMMRNNPEGPMYGGWVLDNFPNTRDQWNVCVEKNILPDDVIILNDNSENGIFLNRRYYLMNRDAIDNKIQVRKEKEEQDRIEKQAEKKRQAEQERREREEAARREREEERRRRIEEGEEIPEEENEQQSQEGDDRDSQTGDNKDDEDKSEDVSPDHTLDSSTDKQTVKSKPSSKNVEIDEKEKDEEDQPQEEMKVPEGPEMEEFKKLRMEYDKDFVSVHGTITGSTSIEPIVIDVDEKKNIEEVLQTTVDMVERQLSYCGWEYTGIDGDEEEEDNEADVNEEEEEAEDEVSKEEDPNRNKKKPLGDTNHFCPVALKENKVLFPGNPEIAAKYREKTYYLSTQEARDTFLNNPQKFLPKHKPLQAPPVRLLILGPRGSGKTLHGRHLAKKLGVFHIAFRERLQELIIAKTKKKVGPEFEDENEEEEEEEEEEEGAITAPDGSVVKDEDASSQQEPGEQDSKESQGEGEEAEGDGEPELNDEEEAIKANLEGDEALPAEILDNIIPQWWQKEPFKSTGFVLEGFPRTAEEVRYLSELGLFPDAAVLITVSDGDVIGRLLPPKLDKWKVKRDKRLAKKQKKQEKAKKKKEAAVQKRREELLKDQEERRKERQAQKASERDEDEEEEEDEDMLGEEEEEEDIEALLAEEFEEEEEEDEEEEELEDDAVDRMRNNLNEMYDNDTNRLEGVQDTLEEVLVPRLEVDGGRKPHIVRYILNKKIKPFIEFRHSLFERVYPVGERLAKRMLQSGFKQPSRFGRWCPVQLKNGECIQSMSGPGYQSYACIYRQHIYFLSSIQAREDFMHDPMTYLRQPSPKPVVPIRLAILGPPKSGKTSLASRFVEEYGLVRLSVGEAMRLVLQSQPQSELSAQMNKHLRIGLTVPDELAVQALEVCMLDMRCQTRGFVLDGYPTTQHQIDLMTERSLIPVRVIELEMDSKEVLVRGTKDRLSPNRVLPLHDSSQIISTRLHSYRQSIQEVRQWYEKEHMNFVTVNAKSSKWALWHNVLQISCDSVKQIQTYLQRVSDGKAASIADMCITPKEFLQRVGDFDQYCPVSLALRGELVDCSTQPTLKFAAEFRGHYYKLASQEDLDQFLDDPEKYVPPLAPTKLPPAEMLPKRRRPQEVPAVKDIELQAYCPVTFLDGKCRYESIVPGDPEMIVEYRGKYYYISDEEKLLKFMKLPETYWNLKLPHKLPPKKDNLPVTGLPMLGFMEQTVSTAVIKGLTAAGNFKPKYPFLSTSRSAILYLAYHLKAYNPKSSDYVRKKYKQKLAKFEETCHLIQYLGDNMTVRYRNPVERPHDFDNKLETFFALRGIEPTPTWIA